MAALADRKPEVKVPPAPGYLTPPPLNLQLKLRAAAINSNVDPVTDRENRDRTIKELYRRLQASYPNFDPKKGDLSTGFKHKQSMSGTIQQSPTSHDAPHMGHMQPPHHGQSGIVS